MTTLITGGNGFLANSLKQYIDGDYYGKDMLDITSRNCVRNLPTYDVLIHYGLEKLNLNFIVYRHNMEHHNVQIFEPGHMETVDQYNNIAKKISNLYIDWKFEKNMIYDLSVDRYLAY